VIRVLYVVNNFVAGGAERHLLELWRRLDRTRFAVEIACFEARGQFTDDVRALGWPVHELGIRGPIYAPGGLAGFARLVHLIESVRPDVIHGYLFGPNLFAALAGRLARAWRNQLGSTRQSFDGARGRTLRLLRQPLPQRAHLGRLGETMRRAAADRVARLQARLAGLEQNLAHLNPRGVLARGYAIVTTVDGAIVDDAARLAVGEPVALAFARGNAEATITRRDGD